MFLCRKCPTSLSFENLSAGSGSGGGGIAGLSGKAENGKDQGGEDEGGLDDADTGGAFQKYFCLLYMYYDSVYSIYCDSV